ncbi:hypothetical protein ASPZODRAFT_63516 [Penicilliopsis zonata CBS 506.65]|uniref:Neutral ceramidase n=1 Tax=Penicilliopsis zonata CBS 506.65 TaxID=1073090 RepID=A0A1L9SJY1_9EURO|nr:hypothetical protein ASPZODRAFT_63516 [Penicilliopsis zonata CBS 506.65]OJJ47539.1 hypothetical protein ASPZODRAFT_63516 [Penicilliopsis zonata CBS 506.65]
MSSTQGEVETLRRRDEKAGLPYYQSTPTTSDCGRSTSLRRLAAVVASIAITGFVLIQWLGTVSTSYRPPTAGFDGARSTGREDGGLFLLGAGKADITGPVVEIEMNGYASIDQRGTGLRQRIYSRAFIIADPGNTDNTFVYIVLDAQSGDTAVRHGVLQGLAAWGGEYTRYGEHNFALTGTHSHSGPGAWMNYLLPQIPSLGFNKQSYQAIVDGALLSIKRAHESLTLGRLAFGSIDLEGANVNRSPYAYAQNPKEERARYSTDVDKTLTMLRFDRASDNRTVAVLNFFPVHGTSLYNNNTLITGDNKGVAAWLLERSVRKDARFADGFVAGFSQSNVGDTSPNVLGAWCEDGSGEQCRYEDSTCGGRNEPCHGRGPFFAQNDEGAKSAFEVGRLQYDAAKTLYERMERTSDQILGDSNVASFHVYQNLANYTFFSPFNSSATLRTCSAALGFSFAAGTSDGPGAFDFTQNGTGPAESNPLWGIARAFVHAPSVEQQACQLPKDILLDVGSVTKPYQWTPNIVDIQVFRVGQLLIVVSASEATTMAGRRWKHALATASMKVLSIPDPLVVLGAPANSYAHYVTTEEEYSVQRYEGASTLYGPNTLAAYVNLSLTYLPYLADQSTVARLPAIPSGPSPPVNTNVSLSFISDVVYDAAPIGRTFGQVVSSPSSTTLYRPGDIVKATFIGANPRNNLRLENTFAAVERLNTLSGKWETVRTDADWNLIYRWERTNTVLGHSEVVIQWQIEDDYYSTGDPAPLQDGTYRIHYYGDAKSIFGTIFPFEGIGGNFTASTSS